MERMPGSDAMFWHMERPDTPVHTLKTLIVDPARRAAPMTLEEVRAYLEDRLGLVPRTTQVVKFAAGFAGRPFWVDDADFDISRHLDERTAKPPGDRAALDAIHGDLAMSHLDRGRPLWAVTLVHGLAEGRQAIIVRLHHAIADGVAAMNAFLGLTAAEPGGDTPHRPRRQPRPWSPEQLRRAAIAQAPDLGVAWFSLMAEGARGRVRARRFRQEHPELPPFLGARRNSFNVAGGAQRVCASAHLPFADLRLVSKASDTTINGVLHTVIAGAMRAELADRGEPVDEPTVAVFGIAADPPGATRTFGNNITPTTVALGSHLADPKERLRYTADSCRAGVELREVTGLDMAGRWATYTCRVAGHFRAFFADRMPRVVNHITTANVKGPAEHRWIGDLEIVDWISFAIAVAPSNVNLTAYSYGGRVSLGLVATPEALANPARFLERVRTSLDELVAAYRPAEAAV